jgi:hypothetical protein
VSISNTWCYGLPPTHNIVQLLLTTWHMVKTMESYHQLRNPKPCLWWLGTLNLYYPTTQAMLTPQHQGVLWFFPDEHAKFKCNFRLQAFELLRCITLVLGKFDLTWTHELTLLLSLYDNFARGPCFTGIWSLCH